LIAVGTIAAFLLTVAIWAIVLWIRVPSAPAFTAKQWTFITAHASDPRVQPCFSHPSHTVTIVHRGTTVIEVSGLVKELPGGPDAFLRCMRTRLHGR